MKAILFDMDRTLVPMDEEQFVKNYFAGLARKLCPLGIEKDFLIDTIWKATGAMVCNNGEKTNEEVFWSVFEKTVERDCTEFRAACDDFYDHEFEQVKTVTRANPQAVEAVKAARIAADKVVLASQPIFPMKAQLIRAGFVGLNAEDFDHVTAYETEKYAKPNPDYYRAICARLGVKPEECLMIGNDTREDMHAAAEAGLNCYLVTDCINAKEGYTWDGPKGTFAQMVEMLRGLDR